MTHLTRRAFGRAVLLGGAASLLLGPGRALAAAGGPTRLDQPRAGLALAGADGPWYVVGGVSNASPNPIRTDVVAQGTSWRPLPAGSAHWYAGAALFQGRLHVVGGTDRRYATRGVRAYDPKANQWRRLTPLGEARYGHGTVAVGDHLYAVGGYGEAPGGRWGHHTVEQYDPRANRWRRVADLYEEVAFAGVAASRGKIYVAGGTRVWSANRRPSSDLYIYDPATNRWRIGPRMPTARAHLALAAAANGRLYAIGGDAGTGRDARPTAAVEEYDPVADRWRKVDPIATPRVGLAALDAGGQIVAAGGYTIKSGQQVVLDSVDRLPYPRIQ
jgi:N-acetylneuraminic acid mutarotase